MQRQTQVDLIKKHSILKVLGDDITEERLICGHLRIRKYAKDQTLFLPDTPCGEIVFVLLGELSVDRYDILGNKLHLATLEQGQILGANLLFSSRPIYPFEVSTYTEVMVLSISRSNFLELLLLSQALLDCFLKDLSDKSLYLTQVIEMLSEKTLQQKLEGFLMKQYTLQGRSTIVLQMTKKALSEQLGIARTSLSRAFSEMEAKGLLQVDGKNIHLLPDLISRYDR